MPPATAASHRGALWEHQPFTYKEREAPCPPPAAPLRPRDTLTAGHAACPPQKEGRWPPGLCFLSEKTAPRDHRGQEQLARGLPGEGQTF